MLLAVDSSQGTSVALLEDDGTIAFEADDPDPRGHAEAIGPLLLAALADRPAVTAVAYGVGPGPYTGLRVGIAAARAAAFALGAELLPVLSHDAVALAAGTGPLVVVADAKRRERFWTAYAPAGPDEVPRRESGPEVGPVAHIPDLPRAEQRPRAALLGRVALLRRAAGLPPEPPEALYLRPADVTLAPRKRVLA